MTTIMEDLNALTLTEPWAALVWRWEKRIETRSWCTNHRGDIAIHAGKGLAGVSKAEYRARCRHPYSFGPVLQRHWPTAGNPTLPDPLPRGAILIIVEIVDCIRTEDLVRAGRVTRQTKAGAAVTWELTAQERAFGDYTEGRWAWLLANPRPLVTPIATPGARRLWRIPAAVRTQILNQL